MTALEVIAITLMAILAIGILSFITIALVSAYVEAAELRKLQKQDIHQAALFRDLQSRALQKFLEGESK